MSRYDNTELLAGIRLKAKIPAESADYTDATILKEADEVLLNRITQEILGTFQEHFVTFFDHTIVSGEQAINIPGYNVGSVVRDVVYFNDAANLTGGFSLPRADLSDIEERVLRMRFSLDDDQPAPLTLKQVGERLCLTKERIRQIQNRALGKLRLLAEDRLVTA